MMIRSARGKLPEIAHSARGADSAVVTGDVTLRGLCNAVVWGGPSGR